MSLSGSSQGVDLILTIPEVTQSDEEEYVPRNWGDLVTAAHSFLVSSAPSAVFPTTTVLPGKRCQPLLTEKAQLPSRFTLVQPGLGQHTP